MPLGRLIVLPVAWAWFQHWNHPRICTIRAMRRLGAARPYWAAWRTTWAYATHLLERHWIFSGRCEARLDPAPGREDLDAALASGDPVVLLGSHAGALELAGVLLALRGRSVVAVTARDPGAEGLLQLVGDPGRGLGGMRTIVADGTARSGLAMLSTLRAGGLLGIKADRVLPGTPDKDTMETELLGEVTRLPLGPARLALAAKARVVAVSVVRSGRGTYRILSRSLPTSSPEEVVRAWAAEIGRHLAAFPDQWFNFHPLWPSDRAALSGVPRAVPVGLRTAAQATLRAGLPVAAVLGGALALAALAGVAVPAGALATALIGLVLVLAGLAFLPGAQVYGPVPCRGTTDAVALTFDDGPDPRGTPAILEALAEADARATFFVLGHKVRAHPELARAIVAAGHELALHGDAHQVRAAFWRPALAADLARAEQSIEEVTGARPALFRPPAGVVVPSLLDVLRARGLGVVGWSVRPGDGLSLPSDVVAARVLGRSGPGDVVLLHDAPPPGAEEVPAARALPRILAGFAARGLRVDTASAVLGLPSERPPGWAPPRKVVARRTLQELVVGPALLALSAALVWTLAA